MALITLTQARNSLELLLKDIEDVSQETFIEWGNYANRQFYNFIIGIDPERFIDSATTYTVSTTPQTSALPADFMNIQPYNTGFFLVDQNGNDTSYQLPYTGFGSNQAGYYIKGSNVIFTGNTPNGNGSSTYRLRYIPILDTLTAMSDTLILDEIYLECVRNDLNTLYQQWDEMASDESLADFRFTRTLNELANTIKKAPDAYGIPDFSNSF